MNDSSHITNHRSPITDYPRVSIITLNWNGWQDTIECLESLYQITYQNYDVIVVDNGSEDESIDKLEEYAEGKIKVESKFFEYDPSNKPIKIIEYAREEAEAGGGKEGEIADLSSNKKLILIKNEKNYGFAEGNNIGMMYALKVLNPDYVLLLNNDTVVDKAFLGELVKAGMSYGRIGICGAKLLKMHNPKIIDSTGHILRMGRVVDRGTRKIDKGQYDNKTDVIGAMAAACLYKREMLEDIGLFDRSFFTVYEDAELSWRAFRNGWNAKYAPNSIVYHKRGGTRRRSNNISYMTNLLLIRNTVTTVKRYGTKTQKMLFTLVWLRRGIFSLIGKILGRNNIGMKPYLESLRELYRK